MPLLLPPVSDEFTFTVSTHLFAELSTGQKFGCGWSSIDVAIFRWVAWRKVEKTEECPDFVRAATFDHITTGLNKVVEFSLRLSGRLVVMVRKHSVCAVIRIETAAVWLIKRFTSVIDFWRHIDNRGRFR